MNREDGNSNFNSIKSDPLISCIAALQAAGRFPHSKFLTMKTWRDWVSGLTRVYRALGSHPPWTKSSNGLGSRGLFGATTAVKYTVPLPRIEQRSVVSGSFSFAKKANAELPCRENKPCPLSLLAEFAVFRKYSTRASIHNFLAVAVQ